MNIHAASSLLVSLVTVAIGVSVLLRDRTRPTYTTFAAFTFMVAMWHLLNFVAGATASPLFSWLALWPAAAIPPTALRFFRHFLAEPSLGGKPRPPRVTLVWTFAAFAGLIVSAVRALTGNPPIHGEPWFLIPFGAYVFGGLYRCILDLYMQYRATIARVEKTRIRYLMVGGFVAITLALTDNLPRVGVTWPTIGNVLTILYLYFLSQTLFRYRLLDLNELIGKMVVLGTLVVLLSAVYGLLLAWIGGGQEGLFLLNTVVASFVILILFEPVRNRLENAINTWLVRQRYELGRSLDRLRRDLMGIVDVDDMMALIINALGESRRVTHASVYLLDSDGAGYDLADYYGQRPLERVDAAANRAFLDRLREGNIDLQVLRREHELAQAAGTNAQKTVAESLDAIARLLRDMHASLVLPMFGSEETEQGPWLLGMIAVLDERSETAFGMDDIDLFSQVAAQAALTIENSQAFEQMKERDRLAGIGQMAAGLAHEIRNPLGAIKGAAQLLTGPDGKPIVNRPEDAAEFLQIIIQEVDRLNNVVTQFLDYARPSRGDAVEHVELDVNDVVRKTMQLVESYEDAEPIELDVRLDELLPPVAGDPEQLRQVFLNLALNAIQAMPGGGRLEVLTTRRRRSALGYGSFAEIRFRDSGPGIPADRQKNLFIPFYTTKEKGTGLGLAISQRIVAQHGGIIEVRSREGQGATFSVFLPALGPSLAPRPYTDDAHASVTQPLHTFRADDETQPPVAVPAPARSPSNPGETQ